MRPWGILCGGAVFAAAWTGCSEHPEPPVERMELVSRFFQSVRNGEFNAAAQQGRKLYMLDRNNSFLLHLVTIHESNVFLRRAQKALNGGDVNGSLAILDEGRKLYPDNRTLSICYSKVMQLRNAKKLIAALEKAQSSAAMSASLTAATTGLGANMTPALNRYFKQYEARITAAAAKERLEAEKAESLLPPPQSSAALPAMNSPAAPPLPPPSGNGTAAPGKPAADPSPKVKTPMPEPTL